MSYKKHIINFTILGLMIMCIGFSNGFLNKAKGNKEIANMYLKENSMSMSQIDEMHIKEEKEEKKLQFTAWIQKNNQNVEFDYLGKKEEVDVIEISGNSDLIVKGPILFSDNEEGCLIDKKTAYSLFGSENAKGQIIKYGERELIIVGIHEGLDNTLITQSLKDSKENVTGIAIGVLENVDRSVKAFSDRYGIISTS
ncbi:MAG: ABC transporter permease, partial [Clostridium sp.]